MTLFSILICPAMPCSTFSYDSASKKVKLFLHPDKLPKDLTENQAQLFKTLWNDLHDKEMLIKK
jgi:hypothetical protein